MNDVIDIEEVGSNFSVNGMLETRQKTRHAIDSIARRIHPGMTEERGVEVAKQTLKELGLLRGWHQVCVRFGPNTTIEYGSPSKEGVVLGDNDIYFIDIGPVWNRCEGDGGATFVLGSDPDMLRAAQDVVVLWQRVHDKWHDNHMTGRALYEFAMTEAASMGWDLNLKRMSGHRIGDFPHKHKFSGMLSAVDIVPKPYLWILEMHIRHRTRPFGAFFEDLMTPP